MRSAEHCNLFAPVGLDAYNRNMTNMQTLPEWRSIRGYEGPVRSQRRWSGALAPASQSLEAESCVIA